MGAVSEAVACPGAPASDGLDVMVEAVDGAGNATSVNAASADVSSAEDGAALSLAITLPGTVTAESLRVTATDGDGNTWTYDSAATPPE